MGVSVWRDHPAVSVYPDIRGLRVPVQHGATTVQHAPVAIKRHAVGTPVAADSVEPPVFYSSPMGPPVAPLVVDSAVVDQIGCEDSRVNGFGGKLETAGYLFGRHGRIVYACPAASDHRATSVRLDHPLTCAGYDVLVGEWHTHSEGDGTPSDSDLLVSGWNLFASGHEAWYSIIATRGEWGWRLHGFSTRPYGGSTDRSKTEPIELVIR
jgi:hypothetical protein